MSNTFKIQIIVILFLGIFSINANENTDIIEKPKSDCEQTEGEKGILATSIGIFSKVRNIVKMAYDEIQYFKGIRQCYRDVKQWFSNQSTYFKQVRNIGTEILTGNGDIFTKLDKAEEMFNIIDHVVLYESEKLDNMFANAEYYYDKSLLIPNTDDVLLGVKYFFDGSSEIDTITLNIDSDDTEFRKINEQYEANKKKLKALQLEEYPEYKVVKASQTIAASGMAKSNLYFQWAQNSTNHYNEIDKKTKTLDNVNEMNLYAVWLMLEQVNANNKKIRHLSEELKLYCSILGFEIWDASFKRSLEIVSEESIMMFERDLISIQIEQ